MATLEQLESAFLKAHNAGNTEHAKRFASEIRRMKAEPVDYEFSETLKNIPSSAKQIGLDMWNALNNPGRTLRAVGGLVESGVEKLNPFMEEEQRQYKPYSDAFISSLDDRYGSMDAVKRTAMEDPVGMLADVSGAVTGVGTVGRMPSVARTGMALDPINMLLNTGKVGINAVTPRSKPGAMYESAAKFSTTIPKPKRDQMVQTALDEGLAPTGRGVAKLDDLIDQIDSDISSLITQATEQGGRVPADAVFGLLGELRNKLGSATQTDGIGNLDKINQVARNIGENQQRTGQQFYTVQELQELKRNLYKSANFDVKQGKADPAVNQARKNIARKSRELIEEKVPEIGALNERFGRLIDLQDPLTRSANRIDNRNLISINQPLNTGLGYGMGGPVGGAVASGLTALGNPKIKPHIAMWLNNIQKQGLAGNMMDNSLLPFMIRQGLMQSGRLSDQQSRQ